MAKKTAPLLPSTEELLRQLGARLRVARLRRRLAAKQVAERAGMSPMTLRSLERGGSGVTMGAYLAVMQVLGIEKDFNLLAAADPVGRDLQDARLSAQGTPSGLQPRPFQPAARARTVPTGAATTDVRRLADGSAVSPLREVAGACASGQLRRAAAQLNAPAREPERLRSAAKGVSPWVRKGGFSTAEELSKLIESPAPLPERKR